MAQCPYSPGKDSPGCMCVHENPGENGHFHTPPIGIRSVLWELVGPSDLSRGWVLVDLYLLGW